MNNEICQEVEELYNLSIYPNCPKKNLCDNGEHCFSKKPKMPFIGRNYGNNTKIPNLLFVSLDSGDEYDNYHTIKEIRVGVESNPPRVNAGSDITKHWYQTFDIATFLLDEYLDESLKLNISHVDSYVAHSNSAKCTQSKKGRAQADNRLFDNCREFVTMEIPLFKADIIITQGNHAHNTLNKFPINERILFETIHNGKEIKLQIFVRNINSKITLHIPMYHPSYYRGYWSQKKALQDNLDKVKLILIRIYNFTC